MSRSKTKYIEDYKKGKIEMAKKETVTKVTEERIKGGLPCCVKFPLFSGCEDIPIEEIGLRKRAENALKREGITTLGQFADRFKSPSDVMTVEKLGKQSAEEVLIKIFIWQYNRLDLMGKEKMTEIMLDLNFGKVESKCR